MSWVEYPLTATLRTATAERHRAARRAGKDSSGEAPVPIVKESPRARYRIGRSVPRCVVVSGALDVVAASRLTDLGVAHAATNTGRNAAGTTVLMLKHTLSLAPGFRGTEDSLERQGAGLGSKNNLDVVWPGDGT